MDFHEIEAVAGRRWRTTKVDWWAGLRVAATDFSLRLDAPSVTDSVDRAYHVVEVGIVGGFQWSLSEHWSSRVEFTIAPQHERFAERLRADAHLVYRLGRFDFRLGVRAERFQYDDSYKQVLPNHLDLERISPEIGITVRF